MAKQSADLWPSDVTTQTFLTPLQILQNQATILEDRMNGLVLAEVKQTTVEDENELESRTILRFEIFPESRSRRVKLFDVVHRRDFPYPAAFSELAELPSYLQERYYQPSLGDAMSVASSMSNIFSEKGKWVENSNVCATTNEFKKKLSNILSKAEIKAAVMTVLAAAQETSPEITDSNIESPRTS